MNKKVSRVCYFGTYRADYARNQIMIAGLRSQGVEVFECHVQLWHGIEDRVEQASGGWFSVRFLLRVLKTYWRLFRTHNRIPEYDVMLIGYPGQFDTFLGRLLSWGRRKPMVLDILMSLYLVAEERGLTKKSPFTAKLIYMLEKVGLHLPNLLISENGAYEAYYCQKYNLSPKRFQRVPHGADDRIYHPRPIQPPTDYFRITYHGMYLPSHGLDAILEAAFLLREESDIQFHLYGDGPEQSRIERLASQKNLKNTIFHGFVSQDDLLDGLAQSHICLGVFGMTKQSHFTIQNKVWEGLAMGRAVVSGDSATVREVLIHKEHIFLVKRNSGEALANGIATLKKDSNLKQHLADCGHQYFRLNNSPSALGASLVQTLHSIR